MNFHLIFGQKVISPLKLLAPECTQEESSPLGKTIYILTRPTRDVPPTSAYIRRDRRRSCVSERDINGNRTFLLNNKLWLDLDKLTNPRIQAHLIKGFLAYTAGLEHTWLLHASAFAVNGKAVLVIGESGAGKSTFAAAAQAMGAIHLSDDATILVERSGEYMVVPSGSGYILHPEMINQICILNPNIEKQLFTRQINISEKIWIPRTTQTIEPFFPLADILYICKDKGTYDSNVALKMLIKSVISGKEFATKLASFYLPFFGRLLTDYSWSFINPQRDFKEFTETYAKLIERSLASYKLL
jgi:hypothetical protein